MAWTKKQGKDFVAGVAARGAAHQAQLPVGTCPDCEGLGECRGDTCSKCAGLGQWP
jgi:DnaJ-class molecular chaperone